MIKEITTVQEQEFCVEVISKAFRPTALELGITIENCPTNSAFIKITDLQLMQEKGIAMFGLEYDKKIVGFVALEKRANIFYLEKLAVLPEFRHRGYGKILMDFSMNYVKDDGGNKISIGIINKNRILKEWYKEYGFTEILTKKFPHLPFTVCFLEIDI